MNYKNITYLQSISPLSLITDTPSDKTIVLLHKILSNQEIVSQIALVRALVNYDPKIWNVKRYIGKNLTNIPIFSHPIIASFTQVLTEQFLAKFNLSGFTQKQMILLIFFNAFVDLRYFKAFTGQEPEYIVGKSIVASRLHDFEGQEIAAILIPLSFSKAKLIKSINNNWLDFKLSMDKYIEQDIGFTKVDPQSLLALEIIQLHDIKKMSFSQIADVLSDKYPDNKATYSGEAVKKLYYRYKKLIKHHANKLKLANPPKKGT